MINVKKNIVLIGMPGAGKSTVGVVVAKRLGFRFVDSDLVIQETYGKLLHELIEEHGIEGFWKLENAVNASLQLERAVIATGGSVCYEPEAMEHLGQTGTIVYLRLTYESLQERLGDLNARGVTLREGQTLMDLYEERLPLYEKYAHITIDCEGKQLREVVHEVCDSVGQVWDTENRQEMGQR
ncbi:MAG: shikimate kinase [Lachnospiraceae bacterium]